MVIIIAQMQNGRGFVHCFMFIIQDYFNFHCEV